MAKLTIIDIARLADVGRSTVSLVINGSPKVAPATRERVLAVMAEHGYAPNAAAASLARGSSRFVGMIVPGLSSRLLAPINYGIGRVVEASHFDVIQYTSMSDGDYGDVVQRIRSSNTVAGVLVVAQDHPMKPLVDLAGDMPVVLINTLAMPVDLPSVDADSHGGALAAVRHLLQAGHRRIACISGPDRYPAAVQRTSGYAAALADSGVPLDPKLVRTGSFAEPEAAGKLALDLLDLDEPPTAFFAQSDRMAYAILDAVADRGLSVPDDVSVVGFDDALPSAHVRPPLTTVRQPFEDMGKHAAELLFALIDGREPTDRHLTVPTELVVRQSSGPAPVAPHVPGIRAAAPTADGHGAGPRITDAYFPDSPDGGVHTDPSSSSAGETR